MKTHTIIIGLFFIVASVARADYAPIALTPGSFNADVVVEKNAGQCLPCSVTVTIDGGTNITGNTFYEQGYQPSMGNTGLPIHGTTFNSYTSPSDHQFQMAPSYTASNNVLYIANQVLYSSGSLSLNSPASYSSISVMHTGGGSNLLNMVFQYSDGTTATNALGVRDWLNTGTANNAWIAGGRIQVDAGTYNNLNPAPAATSSTRVYYLDFAADNTRTMTNVLFVYVTGSSRSFIFGLSGSTGGNYTPIGVSGFNRDAIVENTAPVTSAMFSKTTVTMDNGTNNNGNTFYERGFHTNLISVAAGMSGMPFHGTTINRPDGQRSFQMPATYVGNNCLFLSGQTANTNGSITLTSPGNYQALSVCASAGNGPLVLNYTNYLDDGTFTNGQISIPDWFNNTIFTTSVWTNQGRFQTETYVINNFATTSACKLYAVDFPNVNTVSTANLTNITFSYVSGGRGPIFALCGSNSASSGTFVPIPISGFNADVVVESNSVPVVPTIASPGLPQPLLNATTVSMDGGTNNIGNTWYEQGYVPAFPLTGLPTAGSYLTNLADPTKVYQMAASYAANNAAYVDYAHTDSDLGIVAPTNYSALSFLLATANGNVTNQAIMQYLDGTSETNTFTAVDWFGNTPVAWYANGRITLNKRTLDADPGHTAPPNNPRLYEKGFLLGNAGSVLTNVHLHFLGAVNATSGRAVIMAVSGTAGAVKPIINSVTPGNKLVIEGSNFVESASITVQTNSPVSYQWQAGVIGSGVYTNIGNGGALSGVTTSNLTFTGIGWTNQGDYVLLVSNAAGAVTSSPVSIRVLSGLPDVLAPGDSISSFGGASPGTESVDHAIDDQTQKYLNFGNDGDQVAPFVGPVGFIGTPSMGATIVSVMRIYNANDSTERDPTNYILAGSIDGVNWTTISSGLLSPSTVRNAAGSAIDPLAQFTATSMQEVRFANSTPYMSYRWTVNNVRIDSTANSMQVGEVEILGVPTTLAPVIVRQPNATSSVFVGGSPNVSLRAVGSPTPTYQWYRDGFLISGATRDNYTLANAQLSDSGAAFYCVASNSGGSATSRTNLLTVGVRPTNGYPAAVMADNPIAYLRLGEGPDNGNGNNGVIARDSWGGHDGAYTNGLLGQPGYRNGVNDTNKAAAFGTNAAPANIANSYVQNIPGIDFATPNGLSNSFSVEAWVLGAQQTVGAGIVAKGPGGAEQFGLDCGGTGGAFRFYARQAGGVSINAPGTVGPDAAVWHHVVGVWDQPNSKEYLFVDGLLNAVASVPNNGGIFSTFSDVSIGSRQTTGGGAYNLQFNGTIDDVAIYNYALSSNQVSTHYLAGGAAPPVITLQPVDKNAGEGSTVTFSSAAYGSLPITYRWYDDVTLSQLPSTSNSLKLVNVTVANNDQHAYYLVASNAYGTVESRHALLSVFQGPPQLINDLPSALVVYAGQPLQLEADFGGTAPLAYQWVHNGLNQTDNSRILGSQSNVLSFAYTQPGDGGTWYLSVTNNPGSNYSSTATVEVEVVADFNTSGAGWVPNIAGAATGARGTWANDVLTVTDGAGSEGSAVWYNYPQYCGGFFASFTYQDVSIGGADGACFVLQNDSRGTAAIGGLGGSFAYEGISPSIALELNIFNGHTQGYRFGTNGVVGDPYLTAGSINPASGNPIDISLRYASGVLTLNMLDETTLATFTDSVAVNIPGILGSQTGYVGITGATGGTASTQTVANFAFYPLPSLSVATSGGNVVLTWPASVGGYVLQSTTAVGGSWSDVTTAPTRVGSSWQVTVPQTGTQQFFRLQLALY